MNEEIKGKTCLVIDDSDSVRKSLINILKNLFDRFFEARDGIEGFKILTQQKDEIDIVLCDVIMPNIDGLRFLAMKNSYQELKDIPVIMLTSVEDSERKVKGLEIGAQDWVVKPFEPSELVARVKVHLRIKALQDELRKANEVLQEMAITDPLTMLFNRRYFFESLLTEFERAKRYARVLSLVIFDIDHFKEINDTYGHQVGDRVLENFSKVLKSNLRAHDIIGRYGGEEFAVILPETRLDGAYTVADRFREVLSTMVFNAGEQKINITVSGGIAQYPYKGINTPDDLVRCADNALLKAKRQGRNVVVIWR